jgi:histidine triad (HIT) family protein
MPDCIFCRIVKKEIPAKVVYEDESSVAFLDINPRSTGMTIVASKKHFSNFDEDSETATKIFQSAQAVAKAIKSALNPLAIEFGVIPSKEVPHFHIRIYPVYENEIPLLENQPKKVSEQELEKIAAEIRSATPTAPAKEEVIVEQVEEPKRTEEDIAWIKRQLGLE